MNLQKLLAICGIALGIGFLLLAIGDAQKVSADSSGGRVLAEIVFGFLIGSASGVAYYYLRANDKNEPSDPSIEALAHYGHQLSEENSKNDEEQAK